MNLTGFLPSLNSDQITKLESLADVFLEWNQKMNLSAIRDRDAVLLKHIVDSLLILPHGWIKDGDRVMDLGTGGGFPGLPLAIAYPKADFILVDATEKKVRAVQSMADQLGLKNVRCVAGRAEQLGRVDKYRETFDVVVARALAEFPTLLEYCLPFVKVGGKFIAYQGPELSQTWKQYQNVALELSGDITEVKGAILPVEKAKRCFVVVKKLRKIFGKYPRRTGVPKKEPLG
ncbi:MAG: 16S rRNA (guanine(527)-N(7))-methyltransferase RsmG [bacterium]|nr:16S rRNA (guanine(527)-N(7))-methyltransferase RsmG [bacterium]